MVSFYLPLTKFTASLHIVGDILKPEDHLDTPQRGI